MPDPGRILAVASLSALGLAPGLAVYAATKHAVLAFGTSLAGDLYAAGGRIEVRTLCPDVIDTRMVRDQVDSPDAAILWRVPPRWRSTTSPTGLWRCSTAAAPGPWYPPGGASCCASSTASRASPSRACRCSTASDVAPRALAPARWSLSSGAGHAAKGGARSPGPYWPAVRAT